MFCAPLVHCFSRKKPGDKSGRFEKHWEVIRRVAGAPTGAYTEAQRPRDREKGRTMMSEAEFWSGLEWRICREFAGMKQGRWRNFWCDGLAAGCFDLEGSRPTIRGVA